MNALGLADELDDYARGDAYQRVTEEAAAMLRSQHADIERLKEESCMGDTMYNLANAECIDLRSENQRLKKRNHPVKLMPRELADPEYMQAYVDGMNDDFSEAAKEVTALRAENQRLRIALESAQRGMLLNTDPRSLMSYQEGYEAGKTADSTKNPHPLVDIP